MLYTVVQTQEVSQDTEQDYITAISSKNYAEGLPEMSIKIPSELIKETSSGEGGGGMVKVVSFLYYNVTGLFPSGKE